MEDKQVCLCPVCQKHTFQDEYELCPVCGWTHDTFQIDYPDARNLGSIMSLNEAKQAYKEGKEIY